MTHFKVCPNCAFVWKTRDDFLYDINISFVGYQANFDRRKAGVFLFHHFCKGSFTLAFGCFEDLYDGSTFQVNATESDDCPKYCLHQDKLDPCLAECECNYVREFVQILKERETFLKKGLPWAAPFATASSSSAVKT